jgi:hypothetical protein
MVTYAVTLSDLIEKGGAYAGLAAFFGLAILAILYFAQAREIRRLREWAGRAPERALELEQRVVEQAEQARRVKAAPSRRPGEPATAAAKKAVPAVAAAAGAAAPTKAAPGASKAPPAAAKEAGEDAEEKPAETAAAEGAPKPAADPAPEPAADGDQDTSEETVTEHEIVPAAEGPSEEGQDTAIVPAGATTALAPATDEPADPGNGTPPADPLPPRATKGPPTAPVRRPPPTPPPLRTTAPAGRRPAPREPEDARRGPIMVAAVAGGLVLIVIGLVAILGGGDDESGKQPTAGGTEPAQTAAAETPGTSGKGNKEKEPVVSRAETDVAVLNGTTITGLAGSVNDRLVQAGYTAIQNPMDYTDQARSASVVFYNGSANRTQAIEIAKQLDISDRQPIIEEAAQLAPGADVVVVVGADQSP